MMQNYNLQSLYGQLKCFDDHKWFAVLKVWAIFVIFLPRIMRVARARMKFGYFTYGSEMFEWTPKRRLKEIIEELADAIVYCVGGKVIGR